MVFTKGGVGFWLVCDVGYLLTFETELRIEACGISSSTWFVDSRRHSTEPSGFSASTVRLRQEAEKRGVLRGTFVPTSSSWGYSSASKITSEAVHIRSLCSLRGIGRETPSSLSSRSFEDLFLVLHLICIWGFPRILLLFNGVYSISSLVLIGISDTFELPTHLWSLFDNLTHPLLICVFLCLGLRLNSPLPHHFYCFMHIWNLVPSTSISRSL